MNISLLVKCIFWGTMARVLSELMTVSVPLTQAVLVWLNYGLWTAAGVQVVRAAVQAVRARRTKRNEVVRHEM